MRIGGVEVRPATVLAPMAGVTDTVFRQLIRQQGGCGLIVTEFTSSHGIANSINAQKPTRSMRYLAFKPEEHPISAQLFGSNPEVMARAAAVCQEQGFDMVDINFGCPVNKVVRCNGGSGLLRDLPLVEQLLKAVRAAITIPLTIKIRSGWDEHDIVAVRVGRMAEDHGIDAITLHPRTRKQGYSGQADWRHIAELKAAVKIPVVGNGDIVAPEDAVRMVEQTGCDAVMVGRAALSNPWIFQQIGQFAATGSYGGPDQQDRHRMIRTYFSMLVDRGAPDMVGRMKQFATYFTHGVRDGARLRVRIHHSKEASEIVAQVEEFFLAGREAA
jgi:nifR3 family TIM-barrel protein